MKLRHDAASRAIAGTSSGGICAFTVAWERPDEFSKVLSWVGSFTNIASGKTGREGGHNYEALIRKTPKKPIRVFLQDGANDLDNDNGNWPLANQTLAKSLAFARLRLPASSSARASTATATAARSCRTRCGGCGGVTRNEARVVVRALSGGERLRAKGSRLRATRLQATGLRIVAGHGYLAAATLSNRCHNPRGPEA